MHTLFSSTCEKKNHMLPLVFAALLLPFIDKPFSTLKKERSNFHISKLEPVAYFYGLSTFITHAHTHLKSADFLSFSNCFPPAIRRLIPPLFHIIRDKSLHTVKHLSHLSCTHTLIYICVQTHILPPLSDTYSIGPRAYCMALLSATHRLSIMPSTSRCLPDATVALISSQVGLLLPPFFSPQIDVNLALLIK